MCHNSKSTDNHARYTKAVHIPNKKRATRKKILFELPFIKNRRNKILIHDSQSFQCGSVMERIPDLLPETQISIIYRVKGNRL